MDMEKLLMWLTIATTIALVLAIGVAWLGVETYTTTPVGNF